MKRSLNRPTTSFKGSIGASPSRFSGGRQARAYLVCLCPEAGVNVHGEGVQLAQRRHRMEQQDDDPAALDRFDRSAQKIRRQCLEILEHAHPIRVTKHLVRLLVVAPADVGT